MAPAAVSAEFGLDETTYFTRGNFLQSWGVSCEAVVSDLLRLFPKIEIEFYFIFFSRSVITAIPAEQPEQTTTTISMINFFLVIPDLSYLP